MKKLLMIMCLLPFLASCAGLETKRFVDNENRFYSNYPNIMIKVDKALKYYEEKISFNYTMTSPDFAGGVNVTIYPFGMIVDENNVVEKMLLIIFHKMVDGTNSFISTGLPNKSETMIGSLKFRIWKGFPNRESFNRKQFNMRGYKLSEVYVGFVAKRLVGQSELMEIWYFEKYDYDDKEAHRLQYPEKWTSKQKQKVNEVYMRGMETFTIY